MNEDGTMARVPELMKFAKRHRLKMVTIKALIEYRMHRETFIKRVVNAKLPTIFGEFDTVVFENEVDGGDPYRSGQGSGGWGGAHPCACPFGMFDGGCVRLAAV